MIENQPNFSPRKRSISQKVAGKLSHLYYTRLGPTVRRLKKPAIPVNADGQVWVHIGCGEANDPRFLNIDARPLPHVHYVTHEVDLRPFGADSIDLIYACHVLEHFPFKKVPEVLRSWRGKLRPGGILRLSVPDFACMLRIYEETKCLDDILPPLMGGQEYPTNFHQTAFDEKNLRKLLDDAGFIESRFWDPKVLIDHKFDDWAGRPVIVRNRAYPISLNLEAVR